MKTEDFAFLAVALAFNTFTAPAVKITQSADGTYAYNKYSIYFVAELIKLIAALVWCVYYYNTDKDLRTKMTITTRDVWQYSIPGFVFFAQNNLSFIALQHLSNSAFQLLLNMRIVVVALLTVIVLGKPLNKVKWFAIVLLTTGAIQYQLSGCSEGTLKTSSEGLFVMAIIIFCAAGGNIVTQMVMQKSMDQPLMIQNAMLYSWGVLMNGFNWWVFTTSYEVPWFGDFTPKVFFLCCFSAVYGLSISVILKRFGSLTRTFISTIAVVLNAILDTMFFGESLSVLEVTTFLVIFASIFLFTIMGDEWENFIKERSIPSKSASPKAEVQINDADDSMGDKETDSLVNPLTKK